jgi:hypothetical protein
LKNRLHEQKNQYIWKGTSSLNRLLSVGITII